MSRAGLPALVFRTVLAVSLAVLGGALGIVGSFVQELQHGGFAPYSAIIVAPIVEEALKPAGIYLLLLRWPYAAGSRLTVALLTALSGLVFGIIESTVYVTVYFPDASDALVNYRFSVTLAMHVVASFVMGLGLSRSIIDWTAGRAPFPKSTRNFYIIAVLLHAAFNASVIVLSLAGVLDFEE